MVTQLSKKLTLEILKHKLNYDPETGVFTRRVSAGGRHGCADSKVGSDHDGYTRIGINGKSYLASRLAWFYTYGVWPANEIDHINRDKKDDRICNLREATNAENVRNKSIYKNNKSGFVGVYWHKQKKKWVSCVGFNGRLIEVGLFDSPDEASVARCMVARKLFGEFYATD